MPHPVHRRGLAAAAVAALALILFSACSDDPVEAVPDPDQAAAQQQAEPIDAAEQPTEPEPAAQPQAQPEQQAQAEQPQPQAEQPAAEQPQQGQPAQQQQQPQAQQQAQQEIASDPDRELLEEGERFQAELTAELLERQFRFDAPAGAWLRIAVDGQDGMDPIVTLLQPDGTEIARNDDQSSTNRDSLLIAQLPADGLQLIRVQPYDLNSVGAFIIQVQTLSVGADDEDAVISVGADVNGILNTPADIDIFEFGVAAGEQIFLLVDGDTGVDVYTQVFDPEGDLIQVDDDGGHGLDAEIYFTATIEGLHRVEVWPASNREGQRQLIGAYRLSVRRGLPVNAVSEAVAADLASAALTFLHALRDADPATLLALAGPEALTTWGWNGTADVTRDLAKLQGIDLGDEILQSIAYGDILHPSRGRVYFQFSETDWLRMELIQLAGHWLVDDWAHSVGPPA